jgi:hypothetical protein
MSDTQPTFAGLLAEDLAETKFKSWTEGVVNAALYAWAAYAWFRDASPVVAMVALVLGALLSVLLVYHHSRHVWIRERDRRLAVESKLTRDEARFTGHINKMAFVDPVNGFCDGYFFVSIENIGGRASILHNWSMFVHPPDGLEREIGIVWPEGDEVVLSTPLTGNEVRIPASEFLESKCYPDPIAPGAGQRGFMRCLIPEGLPEGTRFILRFRDANKQLYEADYDTSMRKDRSADVSDLGRWAGVTIRHGLARVTRDDVAAN